MDKNVMLGKDGLVKIGDVGQSREKANNAEYFSTAQPRAIPFMRPESMQEQSHYNEKVDTSLSVLMLEVATQQPPRVQLVGIGTVKEIVRHRKNLSTLEEDHSLKPLDPLQFGGLPLVGNSVIGFLKIDPAHEF